MGRSKMMGAGSACSTLYDCNVNLKTCGGNKKQGLAVKVDGSMNFNHRFIKTKAIGNRRDVVFIMNQLGGVSSSSFGSSSHSYAIGGSVRRKDPFICSPYCTLNGIRTPAQPLEIPNLIETDPIIIPIFDIFKYSYYDGFAHCYTDASQFPKIVIDQITIGGQTLQTLYPALNITPQDILTKIYEILLEEDLNRGNRRLKIDRVDGALYSTPDMTGFTNGTSICSQLYKVMEKTNPERVITCPTRQDIFQSGDEFTIPVLLLQNTKILLNLVLI